MKDLRSLILAAGKGTRMKSSVPKVLHEVCGGSIISYVLQVVKEVGSLKTYVVLGHKASAIEKNLGAEYGYVQQKKLLGTADAVRSAESKLRSYSGDLLILCGDTPLLTTKTIKAIVKKHRITRSACTFLTAVVHDPSGYGRIIRDDQGRVVAIREEKDAMGYEKEIAEINVGVYCFKSKELFKTLKSVKLNKKKKEFYLTDIIEIFVENNIKVETVETEDSSEGLGVNDKRDLAVAEKILRQRKLKQLMDDGITIVDPSTTYIDENVKIGAETVIKPFTVLEKDVKIGKKCIIGPFARMRSGATIGDEVEVGNFTEISRSKVGDKCFVKHFSYLGDATVGKEVNIGAGAVTANFDGKNKNITKISDGAFIGSGAILVSPTKVGKRSILGAGSVLTKGQRIPDGNTAIGVPAKVTKGKKTK